VRHGERRGERQHERAERGKTTNGHAKPPPRTRSPGQAAGFGQYRGTGSRRASLN
jgi:hypothetical protein